MARRVDPVTAYAHGVKAKRIVAGPWVRLTCERHLRDLKERKKSGLVWRVDRAEKAIDFFPEILVLEDGRPFVLVPYQEFVVGSIFGWYDADGYRRFRDAYVETGKGSGKTPLAAGIGIQGLITDGEPAAEIYSAATTQDQAKIAWTDADRMVSQSAELREIIKREAACLTYTSREGVESVFRPVSSEHRGLDGKRPHIAIIDELHEHPSAMVVDKMKAGVKRRRNALIFRITNSGFDRTSVCWKEHDYSIRVLQGTVQNDAWFAYVCALDEGDQFLKNEKCWPKANPGMHAGLPPLSYLRDQVRNAQGMPSKENIVKRLNGCIWTEQEDRWIPMETWNACAASVDGTALRGTSCVAGLDMSETDDFSAFVMLFGPDDDGVYDVLCRFWLPADSLAATSRRPEAVRLQLRHWADQGFIKLTDGDVVDYDTVQAAILEDCAAFGVKKLAFDRYGIAQLVQHLKDELGTAWDPQTGKPEPRVVDFPQNMGQMSSPTKALEQLLKDRKIRHGGHPVLAWMVSNVTIRHGPNAQIKPDKEKSGDKIDGPIALIEALDMATRQPEAQPSPYDTRGFLSL